MLKRTILAISMLLCLALPVHASPMHPRISLLDSEGNNVLESGAAVSPLNTCGACHDSSFITDTSFHAWLGLGNYGIAPGTPGYQALDPVTYSYPLAQAGQDPGSIRGWLRNQGWRHPGLAGDALYSGDCNYEYNCFLCHIATPDNLTRRDVVTNGDFGSAAQATLAKTGIVTRDPAGWAFDPRAFNPDGTVSAATLGITNPSAANCGQCHGPVHLGDSPFTLDVGNIPVTLSRTGEVFSPKRPVDSGLNLQGKAGLTAPWDIHAARLLKCSDCHFAGNDPAATNRADPGAPRHLSVEARGMSLGEYLKAPDHSLARGYGSIPAPGGFTVGNMRRCGDCHDAAHSHGWLPFTELHLDSLSCEACHIPRLNAPARSMTDWTMLKAPSTPQAEYRGIAGPLGDPLSLITGYQPALVRRDLPDGTRRYGPANLHAAWLWVSGEQARPVPLDLLNEALFFAGKHHPRLVNALDIDGDHRLSGTELQLVTEDAVQAVASRLTAVGVDSPRIEAMLRPYGIHHGAVSGRHAIKECAQCHGEGSRLATTVALASYIPGGVVPEQPVTGHRLLTGVTVTTAVGGLAYSLTATDPGIYLAGFHRWPLIDLLGGLLFVLVVCGVGVHAALRIAARRKPGGGH